MNRFLLSLFLVLPFQIVQAQAPSLAISLTEKFSVLTSTIKAELNPATCSYTLLGSAKRKRISGANPASNSELFRWTTEANSSLEVSYTVDNIPRLKRRNKKRRSFFFRVQQLCEDRRNFSAIRVGRLRTSKNKKKSSSLKAFTTQLREQIPFSDLEVSEAFSNLTFSRPVDIQSTPASPNQLFVVEQAGTIRVFNNRSNANIIETFLDISERTTTTAERGLLSMAFHPQYADNGYVFIHFTDLDGATTIERYTRSESNPNSVTLASRKAILSVSQPSAIHNGGSIAFGPDGYLYLAIGDGGTQLDPDGNGQNTQTLLGSVLRIDIDTDNTETGYLIPTDNPFVGDSEGRKEEIYAWGFRNPWRASFDKDSGELWLGDVGQTSFEEINKVEKGKNYGWVIKEGNECITEGCSSENLTEPVIAYGRSLGSSVTGGYISRLESSPSLFGKYIFGDFISGRVMLLDPSNPDEIRTIKDTDFLISTFGVDQQKQLYFADYKDGKIHAVKPK